MVQFDVSVVSIGHALTAGKTGFGAATAVLIASWLPWVRGPVLLYLTAVITAAVDILIHPSHFGPQWLEAVTTGLVAMVLAVVNDRIFGRQNFGS